MSKISLNIKERVLYFAENQENSKQDFFRKVNLKYSNFTGKSKNSDLNSMAVAEILLKYPNANSEWLLTGNGEMLKADYSKPSEEKNLIPYYEDVSTIGGNNVVAETEAVYNTAIQIDAGDWFKGATAAIRHYENSMAEYPSGCILAIKELNNKSEIIWGRNYVVETIEMRITKKIAELDNDYINCYSTNLETHPDGALIHQPIRVKKTDIRYLARVLGSVNKEESTGKVQLL